MENKMNGNDAEEIKSENDVEKTENAASEQETSQIEQSQHESAHHGGHHPHHHHHSGHHHHSSHHGHGKHRKSRHHSSKKKQLNVNKRLILILSGILFLILIALVIFFELENRQLENTGNHGNVNNNFTQQELANISNIAKWDKPIYDANIPVFTLSKEKPSMTNAPCTPDDIYAMYDALMAKHPQSITKTDLGLCSDGINHVYRYDFREPDSRHTEGFEWSETKTKAILVSGIHYEWSGIYGLYYALEEIANNSELYNFRRNTHLIVVPCVNPYATIAENYEKSEGVKNANGVEIHRNFEVDWEQTNINDKHYGGKIPLSEVETQFIDIIMKNNTDAALFLTCHSFADESFNFIWPSAATPYMCNMGYRLIDKMSNVWMEKYKEDFVGLEDYRTDNIEKWDNRLGYSHVSRTNGTETKQAAKYGIQGVNVEINGRFWVHGTKEKPEEPMSSFTMSRGAEVYVNFLLTAFGVYDPTDKLLHGAIQ